MSLPDKPSELIRLAIADLEKVEKRPDLYTVNMDMWHRPRRGPRETCAVCLAGAVMAGSLKIPSDHEMLPANFSVDTRDKLRALDLFRFGAVSPAAREMGYQTKLTGNRRVTPYEVSPYDFKMDMLGMADAFESEGG